MDVVPAVRTTEFGPRPEDEKDDSRPVGVRFVERMNPCILADPYVVFVLGGEGVGEC